MPADASLPLHGFGRAIVIAAHPDDETIAAGGSMRRIDPAAVVFLTDGAPRDPELRSRPLDRERYAALRRDEARAALEIATIPAERLVHLDAVDQEAALDLPRLVIAIRDLSAELDPDVILGHAYEGGHPDHDAAAFAAHAAVALLRREGKRAPLLVEAALYHGKGGVLTMGELLPAMGHAPARVLLTPGEIAEKRAMIAAHASQRALLARFPLGAEYDFSRAPHEGPLWYERLRWPMTGARFRALVAECRRTLELPDEMCP
jgi:LmbE family N-acetylglucosaminyl deacetylase